MNDNPHDHFIRAIFSQPQYAAAELRAVLPAALLAKIDLDTLASVSGSFIDAELQERAVDLLFSVRLRGGNEALIYVLFEHQSTFDPWMPLRLFEYQAKIWQRWLVATHAANNRRFTSS